MRVKFSFLLLFLIYGMLCNAQFLSEFRIQPESPSVGDTITVSFELEFPFADAFKEKSDLFISEDTVVYTGCYFRPSFAQAHSYVYDTFMLNNLAAGYYELFVLRNYVLYATDSDCLNIAFADTMDTFFMVSEPNIIIQPVQPALNIQLVATNKIQIETEKLQSLLTFDAYDLTGKLICGPTKYAIGAGRSQITLDLPSLPAGIYFYKVQLDEDSKTFRVSTY